MDREENKKLEDLAAELVDTPPEEEVDDQELPDAPTPEAMEEAEKLLQQASLAKIRGQGSVAERLLKEASEVAAGSAAVQAALGDQLWARSQFSKARSAYKMAHRLEPKNLAYENKWAESLVGAGDPLSLQRGMSESYASAKTASMLSIMCPGLGQLVKGETKSGAVMISLWIGGWVWALLTPNGLKGIPAAFGISLSGAEDFNAIVLVPVACVVFTWIWSVTSASSHAKTHKAKDVDRPAPPGEGDFEL